MFDSFIDQVASAQVAKLTHATPEDSIFLELHFLVFGPRKAQELTRLQDLAARRYWGAWATETQNATQKTLKDVPVEVVKIPELSADYEDFVRYAGCVKLAKSGVFSLQEGKDGEGGSLQDLALVIGLSGENVEIVTTMEVFLATQQLRAEYLLHNTDPSRPSFKR